MTIVALRNEKGSYNADMNETVNSIALPYYASREKMAHDKGWSLHAQSNPLPLPLRPDLVATLKASA